MNSSALHPQRSHPILSGNIAIGLVSAASLLLLSSCAITQGNATITDATQFSGVQKGKSKKMDVYRTFGQPHDVKYNGTACEWTYYHLNSVMNAATLVPIVGLVAGGSNDTITIAKFDFDESTTLTNHSSSQREKYTNDFVGIAQGTASHLSNYQADRVQAEMTKLGLSYDKVEARKARDIGTSIGVQR